MIFKKYKLLKEENKVLKAENEKYLERIKWLENANIPICVVDTKHPTQLYVVKKYKDFELENDAKRYGTTPMKILENYKQCAKEELAKTLIYDAIKIREDCQEQEIIAYIDVLI